MNHTKKRGTVLLLAALLCLSFAACGKADGGGAAAKPTAETVITPLSETTEETAAETEPIPETTEETQPEPQAPPMYFPTLDNGKYIFGIEFYNASEYPAFITSMVVTDFLEESLVRETVLTKTQIEQASGNRPADSQLFPRTASVEFLEVRPEDVDFDRRVLTVTTTDTEGSEETYTVEYTMDESQATPRVHPDEEEWAAPFPLGQNIYFPCVIQNTTDQTLYLKIYNAQSYLGCVPLRTRTETQFEKLKMQHIAQLEPGQTAIWFQGWPLSYRWSHRKDTLIYEDSQGNTYPMVYRFTGVQESQMPDSLVGFYLRYWGIEDQRQLSVSDIEQMLSEDLTLEETADRISTIADLWQYLYIKGYQTTSGDLKFYHEGTQWHANRSAQLVFQENRGNCGGGSRLANRILEGDYDEQGYIMETGNKGGHIYNYFRKDGLYYVVDLTKFPYFNMSYPTQYQICTVKDLQEFSDAYVAENHQFYTPSAPHYLILQYSVPTDGTVPIMGGLPMRSLSEELEGKIRILYQKDESTGPVFKPAPPKEIWPAAALEPEDTPQ